MFLHVGLVVLVTIFSGAMLGMLLGRLLPEHHLSSDTRAVISLSMAVVGTMSALVLGLLISNASSSFSTRGGEMTKLSADIIRIDRLLRRYGSEADDARAALRRYMVMKLGDVFPEA